MKRVNESEGLDECREERDHRGFDLPVPEEFRFGACLDYMARSTDECLYEVREGQVIRLLRIGGRLLLFGIDCPDDRALRVKVLHGRLDGTSEREEAAAYIRDWFDLERDLAPFYRMAEEDAVLGGLVESFYGLRVMGIPDLFEALCWAIVGQQVNLAFAYKLKRRLTETYGDSLEWEGQEYRVFPLPEQVAGASPDELGGLQLTRAKTAAILEVAGRMSRGELSRSGLLALGSFDEAEGELVRIRGIGPWTAHYVRMRCLRDPGAFLIGDVGLHNAVRERLGLDRKPTMPELQALFADWAGWEAYATFYLWRVLY